MDKGFLIAAAAFLLVMLSGLIVLHYLTLYKKKKEIAERIRTKAQPDMSEGEADARGWKAFIRTTVSRFGEKFRPQTGSDLSKTRTRLVRAGYYGDRAAVQFFGSKVVLALALPVLFLIVKLTLLQPLPAQKIMTLLLCSAVGGFYLPDLYLYRKTRDRKRIIFEAFPDALDLMVVCAEAGMGLDAAIKRVGDEMAAKSRFLSDELKLLSIELRAGKTRVEALRNLAYRTDLEDVSSLVTLLIQTDRFGTRVAQALRVHSDSMRTKRYQRAEEVAAKMPVKILFPLVIFILPATILTLLGPGIIKFYRVMNNGSMQW